MARRLRAAQRESLISAGLDPHRELRARFDDSYLARAWLIDGRLAALGGIVGTILSFYGFVWLVLSEEAGQHPVTIVKEARRQLAEIMITKHELATAIVTSDAAAIRLAAFLGFHAAHQGPGMPAHCRAQRQTLAAEVAGNPALRIPVGKVFAVAMGYHPAR
jgi:hypothetical protein